ncbi:MAG: hypothetical protein K0S29_442 [Gammaproteobacteria bacterium]|jgi:transcriptional regulator with XRE-family HTH domain|nr:hypothetical protein [Gammaproteobacteria bacterium]
MVKKQADIKSSPEAKAERVRSVRAMAGLSRREIELQYQINENTLSGWERAIHGGLSRKGAIKLTQILHDKQILCTVDWLMHGIGIGPQKLLDEAAFSANDQTENSITEELSIFRKNHKNVLDFIAQDNSMAPILYQGDYVAGIQHKQNFQRYVGLHCIVELANGEVLLCKLAKGKAEHLYSLVCLNGKTQYDVAISSLAPIIFIRRTEQSLLKHQDRN